MQPFLTFEFVFYALLYDFPISATAAPGGSESRAGLDSQIEAYIEERAAGAASVALGRFGFKQGVMVCMLNYSRAWNA